MESDTELTDSETTQLDEFLGRVPDGPIQNVEALDGFFAAVICCPDLIGIDEYMPYLLNIGSLHELTYFANDKEAKQFDTLVCRCWNHVSHQIIDKGVFIPFVLVDEDGKYQANDWAQGFLRGTGLRHEIWVDLVKNVQGRDYMIPIWALAYEHDENPEMRPFAEPVSDQQREDLYIAAASSVMGIYKYFLKQRSRYQRPYETITQSVRKTGRNAPCPCGSGRKFKQCCGRRSMLN